MNLAERIFRSREPIVQADPDLDVRNALSESPEVKRHLAEYLQTKAMLAMVAQDASSSLNNPLALANASGQLKAYMAVLALLTPSQE